MRTTRAHGKEERAMTIDARTGSGQTLSRMSASSRCMTAPPSSKKLGSLIMEIIRVLCIPTNPLPLVYLISHCSFWHGDSSRETVTKPRWRSFFVCFCFCLRVSRRLRLLAGKGPFLIPTPQRGYFGAKDVLHNLIPSSRSETRCRVQSFP
jgi:hypothetical protein